MANTITTGELNAHFGVNMTADFLKETLDIEPAEVGRAGHPRWFVIDVPHIADRLVSHITSRGDAPVEASTPKPAKKTAPKPPVDEDDDL